MVLGSCAMAQDESPRASASEWYRQGIRAMERGDIETARQCFHEVLRLRPSNMNARYQLRQLTLRKGTLLAKRRESQLKAVTIPRVDFADLNLREALDALGTLVERETNGKFIPNFVVQDPAGVLDNRRFSLQLSQIPATVVLKYALENAHATARFDEHAIVVKPLGSGRSSKEGEQKTEPEPFGD